MEMSLLRDIDPHEENEEYKQWRLQVKQRLYIHNIVCLSMIALMKGYIGSTSKVGTH